MGRAQAAATAAGGAAAAAVSLNTAVRGTAQPPLRVRARCFLPTAAALRSKTHVSSSQLSSGGDDLDVSGRSVSGSSAATVSKWPLLWVISGAAEVVEEEEDGIKQAAAFEL